MTVHRSIVSRPAARGALVTCLAASGIFLMPGGAKAASIWHVDPTGDVVVAGPLANDYAVRNTSHADIRGFGASYDSRTLQVSTSLREYQTLDGMWEAKVRTSQGYDYRLEISLNGEGQTRLRRSSKTASGFFNSPCAGLTVARTDRGIAARIPTTCLGGAWRVRVGVRTAGAKSYPTVSYRYYDDALVDGRSLKAAPVKTATIGPWLDQH